MDAIDLNATHTRPSRFSRIPHRGLVVAGTVVALGAVLTVSAGRGLGSGDLTILATMAVTAIVGANEARRIVASRQTSVETSEGTWMNVVVGPQGPSETAGHIAWPKAPPGGDPERRSLVRRAKERREAATSRR